MHHLLIHSTLSLLSLPLTGSSTDPAITDSSSSSRLLGRKWGVPAWADAHTERQLLQDAEEQPAYRSRPCHNNGTVIGLAIALTAVGCTALALALQVGVGACVTCLHALVRVCGHVYLIAVSVTQHRSLTTAHTLSRCGTQVWRLHRRLNYWTLLVTGANKGDLWKIKGKPAL